MIKWNFDQKLAYAFANYDLRTEKMSAETAILEAHYSEVDQLREENGILLMEVNAQRMQIEEYKADLELATAAMISLGNDIKILESENAKLKAEIAELKEQIYNLHEEDITR